LLCFVPIVNVFWTFYVWFFPGQERPNRFGNVPSPATLERALGLAGLTVVAMLMFSSALDMQTSSHRRDADAAHAAAVARTIEDGRTPSQVEVDLTLAYEDGMWRFAAGEDGATPIHGRADFERLYAGEPLTFLASHYADASMRFAGSTARWRATSCSGMVDGTPWRWSGAGETGCCATKGRSRRSPSRASAAWPRTFPTSASESRIRKTRRPISTGCWRKLLTTNGSRADRLPNPMPRRPTSPVPARDREGGCSFVEREDA